VSELHSVYYEQNGNKEGKPVLFLWDSVFSDVHRTGIVCEQEKICKSSEAIKFAEERNGIPELTNLNSLPSFARLSCSNTSSTVERIRLIPNFLNFFQPWRPWWWNLWKWP
jgi:hypothetical protein